MDKAEFEKFLEKLHANITRCSEEETIALMRAWDNSPAIIEKNREAAEALKRNPIPEWVLNRTPRSE